LFRFSNSNILCILIPHACYVFTHFILQDISSLIVFGEEYKLLCSSLCSFLHAHVTLSLWSKWLYPSSVFLTPFIYENSQSSFSVNIFNQEMLQTKLPGFSQSVQGNSGIVPSLLFPYSWRSVRIACASWYLYWVLMK
jgi:hypothetical protein